MEEGLNAESNLNNSENTPEKPIDEQSSDSITQKNEEQQNQETIQEEKKFDNRNIIPLEPDAEDEKLEENESTPEDNEKSSESEKDESKEERASFKDKESLDNQVNKNQNSIKVLEEKLASLTEDVDDLISLYEIVSVEMNPFVGLSKITTKRLDALENIDKEFESLKERIEELEAVTSRVKASIPNENKVQSKDITIQENIDYIIEKALKYLTKEKNIDEIIDKFIQDRIGKNTNLGG